VCDDVTDAAHVLRHLRERVHHEDQHPAPVVPLECGGHLPVGARRVAIELVDPRCALEVVPCDLRLPCCDRWQVLSIFVLVELAWNNAGKRTGSSNHEKPHNLSAGQVRSGPVSAPGAAVMSRLQFTTGGIKGVEAGVAPPFERNTVSLSHCAHFPSLSRAIDETDSSLLCGRFWFSSGSVD